MKHALVVWFTGLSGSGKSTIAGLAANHLISKGFKVEIVDGDVVRETLTANLGFSYEDIFKNNHIIADICLKRRPFCDIIFVPVISPFNKLRQEIRQKVGEPFLEVYIRASVETVSKRDPKGLYKLASEGKISSMVGLTEKMPYEVPQNPDLVLNTEMCNIQISVDKLTDYIMTFYSKRI